MTIPSHFKTLIEQNPSAFLLELAIAEQYILMLLNKQNEKPNFSLLAGRIMHGNPIGKEEQLYTKFFEELYNELQASHAEEAFPRSQLGKDILKSMEEAHLEFTNEAKGNPFYKGLYYEVLPGLVEIRKRFPGSEKLSEVACLQMVVFLYTVSELQGNKISDASANELIKISNLLNALGELMMKKKIAQTIKAENNEDLL